MRKFLSLCIALALTTSLIPIQAVSQGMQKNKIESYSENDVKVLAGEGDTNVDISPWQFFQTGTSTQEWNPYEVCAFSKIVTSENEILEKSNFSYTSSGNTHYYNDKTIKTTKSANGFSATIENNGWSAKYNGEELSGNSPYTLSASTEVNFKEGNKYQISFDASIDDDARCEVEGEALDSSNRFASTNVKYAEFWVYDDSIIGDDQLSKTISITKKQKRYTYEYDAYYDSDRKIALRLGAFLYKNEDVLTKEANWSGTVNISNFSVKKIGDLNNDKPTTEETTEEPTTIDYSAGDNAYYSFDEYTGVLTINGTGKVNKVVPEQLSEKVKKAVVSEGITEIGEKNESESVILQPGIFDGCVNMTDVSLPTTLKSIGRWAFAYCTSLKSLTIPKNVTSIKKEALKACTSLEKLTVLNANLAILNTDVPDTTTIYANLNSRAKSYCDMSGNPFVAIDETTPQVTTPQVTTPQPTTPQPTTPQPTTPQPTTPQPTTPQPTTSQPTTPQPTTPQPTTPQPTTPQPTTLQPTTPQPTTPQPTTPQPTTPQPTTPQPTTPQPTTTSEDLQIIEPLAPSIQVRDNSITVIIRNNQEQNKLGILYNIYLDGNIIYSSVNSGSYSIKNISSGDYIIKVTSVLNGQISKGVEVGVRIENVENKTTKKSIKINVEKAFIKNAKNVKKKKIKLTLKKIDGVSGYEIQYSTNSKFSGAKKKITKKPTYIISKLNKHKKYFIKARAFKNVSGKKCFGKWSNIKKIRISK